MRFVVSVALSLGLFLVACSDDDEAPGTGGGSGTAGSSGTTAGTNGASGNAGSSGGTAGSARCGSEDDCSAALPHCDTASGACTGCRSDDDCRGALFCDTGNGICRDCVTNAHCGGTRPICDAISGQCTVQCTSDADCAATRGPSKCDTTAGRGVCVDCIGPNQPCEFCETVTFSCVGCLVDGDCPASAPFCGPSKECSPACTSANDCPGQLFCDPKSSRCLECVTNAHCPGEVCQTDYTCG
jgi:Cys-rich repeat protein